MRFAHARDPAAPGKIVRVYANSLSEKERYTRKFICPLCGEETFYVQKFGEPEMKGYRPPHFKHQKRTLCDTDECDLRNDSVEPGTYISQRIRTPLFLRLGSNGRFTLSAGFNSANKELLRKLWDKDYRAIQIRSRKGIQGETSIEKLLHNGDMGFIDLSEPIVKQSDAKLVAAKENGSYQTASALSEVWEETLDWFGNPACTGAIFECGSGLSGQKVMTGDCVESEKDYLLAVKNTGWPGETILHRALSKMDPVGCLPFCRAAAYTVYKVRLPDSRNISQEDYEALSSFLQERIGVLLCDTKPGFEPIWPPAAKKSNACFVGKMKENKMAIVSVSGLAPEDTIYIHRNTDSAVECDRTSAGLLQIASIPLITQLQPVSIGLDLENSPQSYKLTDLKSILIPAFYAQQTNSTKFWDAKGNCTMHLPATPFGYDLRSNCGFTLYEEGGDMHVLAGEKYHLDPTKALYLVVTDAGQIVVLHTISAKTPRKSTNSRKNQGKYTGKYSGKYMGKYK